MQELNVSHSAVLDDGDVRTAYDTRANRVTNCQCEVESCHLGPLRDAEIRRYLNWKSAEAQVTLTNFGRTDDK